MDHIESNVLTLVSSILETNDDISFATDDEIEVKVFSLKISNFHACNWVKKTCKPSKTGIKMIVYGK